MRTLIFLFLAGCSCNPRPTETPSAPEAPPPVPQPNYEVHEWGLINVGTEGTELAAGAGQQVAAIENLGVQGYGKPVLYFHLAEDSPSFDVRVSVNLRSFRPGEHYPAAESDGRSLVWNGRLEQSRCTAQRTYPAVDGTECQASLDGYCEASELADYETADHSCFHIGDAEWPLLFYRGLPDESRPVLPLTLSIDDEGNAMAQRSDDASATIGKVWYMVDQEVRAVVDWPAAGESVALVGAVPSDAREQMHAELIEHGLSEEEAHAFGRAWFEELFGASVIGGRGSLGLQGTGRGGGGTGEGTIGLGNAENTGGQGGLLGALDIPTPVHRLVYWLPAANHDAMAELEFAPAPSVVHRATLVRERVISE